MTNIFDALKKQTSNDSEELVIGVPEENTDSHFQHSGCDFIDTLACDVTDVNCVIFTRNAMGRIIKTNEFTASVCHAVLDAYHNGTNYYKDERGDWRSQYEMNFKKASN